MSKSTEILPYPVSDAMLRLSLEYTEDCDAGHIADVILVKTFSEFPTEAVKDYFYKSDGQEDGQEYVIVAVTNDKEIIYPCKHLLLINNTCWVQIPSDIDIGSIENLQTIEIWEWKEYDWLRFDSQKCQIVGCDIDCNNGTYYLPDYA